ncbi:uncharacterized protein LOC132590128 [Heteronotia binoei]|uniref:uncharacterized protein LOC132590128 n=1 Tax=Heteronotia binoei TaxID=13085 RepID=UPI00292F2299|nr:uncharacterized protein LOC132590128 [Heteronotia binoei]
MVVLIFVDDLIVLVDSNQQLNWFQETASKLFTIKHLGPVSYYLGVEISRKADRCFELPQSNKVKALLARYGMEEASSVQTPMTTGYSKEPEGKVFQNVQLYQSLIGSLLHLACWSRPDISYAVHILGQKNAEPHHKDWVAAKRVLRYLSGTIERKLSLRVGEKPELRAYADASWGDRPKAKSTTGIGIFLGDALLLWKATKQTLVACSTCEAEYGAINECVLNIEYSGPKDISGWRIGWDAGYFACRPGRVGASGFVWGEGDGLVFVCSVL